MALNLVRNSKVYFTTNVNSTTGAINTSGFTTANTQEIQVLDGFTFSQNTNADTVTISEAGGDPVRGQRSFNTSLAPVDFSFSTYVRPYSTGSAITAEESGLWNALLGTVSQENSSTTIPSVTTTAGASTYAATTGILTIAVTALPTNIAVNNIITLTGLTTATAGDAVYLNAPAKVLTLSSSAVTLQMINPRPDLASISQITAPSTITVHKAAWAPVSSSYSLATTAGSNKNQLLKFGMIFVVDSVTYAVDNCAMNQVTLDFGLDAIATLAWTGQATTLREISLTGGITINSAAVTNLPTTENIFVGNVVRYTGAGGLTSQTSTAAANNVSISSINGPTSLTLTGGTLTSSGTASDFKVYNFSAAGTIGTVTGSASPWTAPVTGLTSTQGISVGDIITASNNVGVWGTGTAKVISVDTAAAITVQWTGGVTPTAGTIQNVYTQIATLSVAATALTAAAKNTSAPFITNKLSTVSFKTLNALGSAAATTYAIALTGGSLTINNNISYITPANLGVVNVPAVYYTGTRSITGTMNAYLKTGSGVGGTGQLLSDMLAAASASVEPMAALTIAVGGSANTTKVELDMPAVTFSIPSIDVQQVISTAINFTAEGSDPSSTVNGNTFDVGATNDLSVRYYAA
jgi:hypothetical protein